MEVELDGAQFELAQRYQGDLRLEFSHQRQALSSWSQIDLTQASSCNNDLGQILFCNEHHPQIQVKVHPHKVKNLGGD